jgi:hypothetical protein
MHRVCRVESAGPSVQSSELGPPTPSSKSECCPPPFGSQVQGGDKLAFGGRGRGGGGGGPNSYEGTGCLVLSVMYNNPST